MKIQILNIFMFAVLMMMALFFVSPSYNEPIQNKGSLKTRKNKKKVKRNVENSDENSTDFDPHDSSVMEIKKRAMGLNNLHFRRKTDGKYKRNNYEKLDSGFSKTLEKNFKVPDIMKNYTDKFEPINELDETLAMVDLDMSRKKADRLKHDLTGFLPKQKNKDWFESIETVDVNNAHLINIYRPLGTNTIGNSHKNSTWDLRGTGKAICPQFVVSPWLQSSYQPDRSTKELCN
jgi:hypothetical protein